MQVTETLAEGLKRGFTVVVPAADIESRRTARLTDLSKTLRLPGFRPGRVPLPLVRQRYGTAVTAEVLEDSVNQATNTLLSERSLRPAQPPKIDVVSVDTGNGAAKDLEFKVEFEALPQIALPDLGQIALTRRVAKVPADVIDRALADVAARNRDLVEITADELAARTDQPGAAKGEILTIDFVGKIGGVPFPNGTGTGVTIEVGSTGAFIADFADQVAGMRPGEERTVTVTFPPDYGNKDLAGKEATFDVTATKLSRYGEAAVSDALAQKLAFDDLAEFRSTMEARFQRENDALSRMRLKRDLLDALAERVDFPAPQGLVDHEFDQIWQRLEEERKQGRLDEDDKDKDEATLRADYRAIAERRVRLGLVLAEVGRANTITVTPDEMARAKRAEATRYPGQEARMMEFFRKYPEAENALRGPIFEEKVVDFILEQAKVTEEEVTPAELAQEGEVSAAASGPAAADSEAAPGGTGAAAAEQEGNPA